MMWYFWFLIFLSYCGITWHSLKQSAKPSLPCAAGTNHLCFRPLIITGAPVTIELQLYQKSVNDSSKRKYDWTSVETCRLNVTLPDSGTLPKLLTGNGTKCQVALPSEARHRSSNPKQVKPFKARFLFLSDDNDIVSVAPFELTRINERRPGKFWTGGTTSKTTTSARNLLEEPVSSATSNNENTTRLKEESKGPMWIPYLKYGSRAAVRIRFVAEDREYGILRREDGLQLKGWNHTTYAPLMYVDELSLQRSAQIELAPPEDNKPPIELHLKLGSLSPMLDSLNRQVQHGFGVVESMIPGEELDEIRYFLQDERLYRFILTQAISYVHMWVDYMAFQDEIRFYRGRKNLSGVSTSSVVTKLICSIIILLYLLDGGGTSWVVILSLCSSCAIEGWKVWRLLRPTLQQSFPFISIRQLKTAKEQETASYDRIASTNLAMIFYPLVIGWSLYALHHYEYTSWYSWLISNLANAVYTFGFISLCPQLYVNYRLKSVAHLPWKVFVYKMFNTFVDDAFAWLIEMPWKHRIMTLRDDVIFLLFLVQVYVYRVDKARMNEFGYSYETDKDTKPELQNKERPENDQDTAKEKRA